MKLSELSKPKSDQLNADDLIGGPLTITIRDAVETDDPKQTLWVYYYGDGGKPYKPNTGMRRAMAHIWGDPQTAELVGRSLMLYQDPSVKFGSDTVGGIRIAEASHMAATKQFLIAVSKGKRQLYTVKPLTDYASPMLAATTLDQLKQAWDAIPKAEQPYWAAVKDESKARITKQPT